MTKPMCADTNARYSIRVDACYGYYDLTWTVSSMTNYMLYLFGCFYLTTLNDRNGINLSTKLHRMTTNSMPQWPSRSRIARVHAYVFKTIKTIIARCRVDVYTQSLRSAMSAETSWPTKSNSARLLLALFSLCYTQTHSGAFVNTRTIVYYIFYYALLGCLVPVAFCAASVLLECGPSVAGFERCLLRCGVV